ncbi:Hsp20/alpha crystallin family protein [Haloarchaeobius salinus]|uniref:Hsp20/alpha crystallin family protein n=1 Tax=Haloarchaeobius salinus TaxID=1198298 RepID=UPI00210A6749|nr:Hsp20/alpha crystallin family protein [Haloarchaeobius salinus]
MRRNPFEELEEMFDRMGRQFEQRGMPTLESVPVDMRDHGDEYEIVADVPGYDTEDIELTFSEGTITIDASREEESAEEHDGHYVHQERRSSVSRSIRLPEPVDEEAIGASYSNGTLTVTAPKAEADEGHRIDIE